MRYPSTKPSAAPTPADMLLVCDACQVGEWYVRVTGPILAYKLHLCAKLHRPREATPEEYAAARATLEARTVGPGPNPFPIRDACEPGAPGTVACTACGAAAGYHCVELSSRSKRPYKVSAHAARREAAERVGAP
jgi:hypothetical protein